MKNVALIGASGFVGTVILNVLMRGTKCLLQSFTERGCIIIEITYHSVIPSVAEESQDWLSEMFRLRFAPLNMTE